MRKFFTLLLVTLFTLTAGVNAQEKIRRTWDFTKGFSAATIANLEADEANWTPSVSGTKLWAESKARSTAETEVVCKVNGEDWVVPETKGILFGAKSAKHINLVYQDKDGTHIWLNGAKGEDYILLKKVPAGENVTIVYSSHGGNADRGFSTSSAGFADENGQTTFTSAGKDTVILINSNSEEADLKLSAKTGGMHFYFIQIGEGDVATVSKVAYLYSSANEYVADNDVALNILKERENTELTMMDVSDAQTTITLDGLLTYDVTVISSTVPADGATARKLKDILPYTPVLNLNGSLYETWGYGTVESLRNILVKKPKNGLFASEERIITERTETDINEQEITTYILNLSVSNAIQGIKLGDFFKNSDILAVGRDDETVTAIHSYSLGYNGYIYLPMQYTTLKPSAAATAVLSNAITMLADSKDSIQATSVPKIVLEYKDMNTDVTINAPKQEKAKVYYTLDGTEPTEQSTLYEGTFNMTKACTVKAVAIAEGYTLSPVVSAEVELFAQPKAPVANTIMENGKTTIKLTCETDSAVIWYNFNDVRDTLKSTKYIDTVAVVVTMPQNLTAFTTIGEPGKTVYSELTQERVLVSNPRVVIDVAAHFAAPQWTADNNPEGKAVANGKGMFSWGASAVSKYIGEVKDSLVKDSLDNDVIIKVYPDSTRAIEAVNEPGENPEWVLISQGTCLIWQNTTAQTTNFGDDSNYNPMYSTDVDPLFPVTKNDIQFYKFASDEPGNGSIQTINKYQAPLDVVVLANTQGGPLQVQVSADSLNWSTIGEIAKSGKSRMWSKYTYSYDEKEQVYVRLAQETASGGAKVFDIYIANQGEKSQALLKELEDELNGNTGISEVSKTVKVPAGIYNLRGLRMNQLQRGLNIIVTTDGQVRKVMK